MNVIGIHSVLFELYLNDMLSNSGIQTFRYSGIQAFRHSGIQAFRHLGIKAFKA